MKVCDAMKPTPPVVDQSTSISECARMMRKHKADSLLVKDQHELVGILTESDFVYKAIAFELNPKTTPVELIMEKKIISISPEKDVYDALVLLRDNKRRQLPVLTEKKKLVGMLSMCDILRIEPTLFELLADKMETSEELRRESPQESEGICQLCSQYTEKINNIHESSVCTQCQSILTSNVLP